jgi:hypothetical protein
VHSRKTGKQIREVRRDSSGFEIFGDLLDVQDEITPPNAKRKGKARRTPLARKSVNQTRDDGDSRSVSMEIDEGEAHQTRNCYLCADIIYRASRSPFALSKSKE